MAQIVVKDLAENAELDREAMRAIVGGRAAPHVRGLAHPPGSFRDPASFASPRLLPGMANIGFNL